MCTQRSSELPRLQKGLRSLAAALVCVSASIHIAHAVDWPQEIAAPEGKVIIYQPQPERLSGNVLDGRAAMSLELTGKPEPIFGAFWFTSRIDADRDDGTVLMRDVRVTKVHWPDSSDAGKARFTDAVEDSVPKNGFVISREQLSASLATAQREQQSLAQLKNDPPQILFSEELAVLLLYDGEPRFVDVENSSYERALNTPFAVARDKKSKRVYSTDGAQWYQSSDPKGPFVPTGSPPADLQRLLPPPEVTEAPPKKAPKVVVATVPTELIVTDGKPNWKTLTGGKILYVVNTETPWLRETSDQQMYVLLSGRWFRATSERGPWTFVRPDQLPDAFKEIPPASEIGGLRSSVAGTQEAEDAMLDAQIPKTAAIKRSEAKLDVKYDGAPRFEKIPNTKVSYAVNTGTQVLEIDKRYYAVDNGVWFTSKSATGPWQLADSIPKEEIEKIPPSSPVYNTTYVEIYQSTPEVVYVGYTPGYVYSYPYYGVPVYGTGWYYPPYWGSVYYPRPATWGFHVGYNPWTGWNFGVSWSNGFFSMGVAWGGGWGGYHPGGCCGGWYGGGYNRNVNINTGDINIGNNVNVGNRRDVSNRLSNSNIDRGRLNQNNLYQRGENSQRLADRSTAQRSVQQARAAPNRENNVFADSSGAVARRDGDQWQTRENGAWQGQDVGNDARGGVGEARGNVTPEQRDQAAERAQQARDTSSYERSNRSNIDHSDLNRSSQARQSGAAHHQSRPMRSGGGRRR